jgi:hypothetical protein
VYLYPLLSSILPVIDLGGGALNSEGYNSIYGNTTYDVDNELGTVTISAQHNWWGRASPLDSQFSGNVDHTNPLSVNPN